MKALITRKLANDLVINKFGNSFDLMLVGSVAKQGMSYNDMDILITYTKEKEVDEFCNVLQTDGWKQIGPEADGNNARYKRFSKFVGDFDVVIDLYVAQHFSSGIEV